MPSRDESPVLKQTIPPQRSRDFPGSGHFLFHCLPPRPPFYSPRPSMPPFDAGRPLPGAGAGGQTVFSSSGKRISAGCKIRFSPEKQKRKQTCGKSGTARPPLCETRYFLYFLFHCKKYMPVKSKLHAGVMKISSACNLDFTGIRFHAFAGVFIKRYVSNTYQTSFGFPPEALLIVIFLFYRFRRNPELFPPKREEDGMRYPLRGEAVHSAPPRFSNGIFPHPAPYSLPTAACAKAPTGKLRLRKAPPPLRFASGKDRRRIPSTAEISFRRTDP